MTLRAVCATFIEAHVISNSINYTLGGLRNGPKQTQMIENMVRPVFNAFSTSYAIKSYYNVFKYDVFKKDDCRSSMICSLMNDRRIELIPVKHEEVYDNKGYTVSGGLIDYRESCPGCILFRDDISRTHQEKTIIINRQATSSHLIDLQ